jgi:hypothetical protein
MNAAERLWSALATQNWDGVAAQFHENATVEWPHEERKLGVADYIAEQRARSRGHGVEVRRVVSDGRLVAIEAAVGAARCAGFYDLHDGRVAFAVEFWLGAGLSASL